MSRDDALLAQRPFVLFWIARVFAMLARQMLTVAVGWQMYALTGSALDLGFVGLAQFLPSFLLVLVSGHVADRFDRRRVLQAAMIVDAAAVLALCIASALGRIDPRAIFMLVFVIGAARAFDVPTMQALLPAVVPERLLARAVAANASASQAAIIVGPAAGGLLYIAGPAVVYGTSAVLFIITAALVHFVHPQRTLRRMPAAGLSSVLDGIRFIRSRPEVLGAISLDMFAVLLGGATALLPIYARDILHTGPWGLGMLRGAPAVGALIMAGVLARHTINRRVGMRMFQAVIIFGVGTVAFAVSHVIWLSLLALAIMGAADVVSMVIRVSLVQVSTPDEMRGRVGAVNFLFINASNQLGQFESGVTAALFGTVPSAVLGGVATVAIALLWMRLFPALRDVERLE